MTSQPVIIDTGFFVALHTKKDEHFERALEVSQKIKHRRWITTWPVMAKTCHFFVQ